jgi:hypothetical protein
MHAQKLQQLKKRIATVHVHREGLKQALESGNPSRRSGFAPLSGIDEELSWLDSLYKNVWDNARTKSSSDALQHPAAKWAMETAFEASQLDCITTIMLKILDAKCKMEEADKIALSAVYDVVKARSGQDVDENVHALIAANRKCPSDASSVQIHDRRVQAEERIPKPVMKSFKQFLRTNMPR